MDKTRFSRQCYMILLGLCLVIQILHAGEFYPYDVTASSFTGGDGAADSVRGCAIQSTGTVVLGVNTGDPPPAAGSGRTRGVSPASLIPGRIWRLSPEGRHLLTDTPVGDRILDLALDAHDCIYAALWTGGLVKLDPTGTTVLWSVTDIRVTRVDVGPQGHCVVLAEASDPDGQAPDVYLYDPNGVELTHYSSNKAKYDVCLDESSETVIYVGFRNAFTSGNPVQIAYIQGLGYSGEIKYTCYDWSANAGSPDWLNRPTNNMADTRGYRCSIGRDGKLYCAFECAGGNHMFRYSPFNIMQKVSIVGGDRWHEFYNTKSEHKTFFARYDPATGDYLKGQQFCCRLSNDKGNTVRMKNGQIKADAQGRVYLCGSSAWGLPIPSHPKYSDKPGRVGFNPLGGYLGGAWVLVMSPDFRTRLYCAKLASDVTHAVAARALVGNMAQIVCGGSTESEAYIHEALIPERGGDIDGWFTVISHLIPGDLDRSGCVDPLDLMSLSATWLANDTSIPADIGPHGADGQVNFLDFALMAADYRRMCQPGSASPAGRH